MMSAEDELSNTGLGGIPIKTQAIRQEFVWDEASGTFQTVNLYTTDIVEITIADLEEILASGAAGDGLILGRDCGLPYYYYGGSWHTMANRTRYKGYDLRAEAAVTRYDLMHFSVGNGYTRVDAYDPAASMELANGWKVDVTQEYTDWGHEVKMTAPLSDPPPPYRVSYVYGDPHLLQAGGTQQQELAAVGNYVFDLGGYTLDLSCMKSHDSFSMVTDLTLTGPNGYQLTMGRNGEVKISGGTDGDPQAKPSLPSDPEIEFIEAPTDGATLDASGVSIKVEANEFLQNAVLNFGGQDYPMTDMDGDKGLRWEKTLSGLDPDTYSFSITGTDSDGNPGASSERQVILGRQSSSSVPTATGTGTATFTIDNGNLTSLNAIDENDLTCPARANLEFPHGFFSFTITELTPGQTVIVTIELPSDMPTTTQYWKCHDGVWVDVTSLLGFNHGGRVLTLTFTDGELGDDDGEANGTIVDDGGPGNPPSLPPSGVGGEAYPVNKLGILAPWIVLVVLLIGGIGWFILRHREA